MGRSGDVLRLASTAAILGATWLAAGCSTPEDSEPVGTGTVAGTVPATSAAPTSSPPSTTDAPTTTLDPAAQLAADVEADLRETFRLTDEAIQDPTDQAKVSAALDRYLAENRQFISDRIESLRAQGHVARRSADVPPSLTIEVAATPAEGPPETVIVRTCEVDSWIVVEPGAGPNGSDAVVDSEVRSYRSNFVLQNVDGVWRVRGGESLGEWSAPQCPPA
jgi:hypothetical protein